MPSSPYSLGPTSIKYSLTLLFALGTMWGGITVLAKVVGDDGVPALGYAFWQTSGAAIILLTVCLTRGKLPPLSATHIRHYFVVGALGSAIPSANLFYALSHLPAGVVALVITTVPLITYLLSLVFRLEGFDWWRAGGIVLGFAGTLLVLLPEGSLPNREMTPFVLLAFLSPFFYSCSSVYAIKFHPPAADSLHVATGMMGASCLMLLPASLATGTFYEIWHGFNLINGLIVAHMFLAALTFHMYLVLLRRAGPVYFSQVAFIVTLTAVFFGILFLGEQHSLWIWASLVLIFAGVALVNIRHRSQSKRNTT